MYNSVRVLFALIADRIGAKVRQMDINTAFLYSTLKGKVCLCSSTNLLASIFLQQKVYFDI